MNYFFSILRGTNTLAKKYDVESILSSWSEWFCSLFQISNTAMQRKPCFQLTKPSNSLVSYYTQPFTQHYYHHLWEHSNKSLSALKYSSCYFFLFTYNIISTIRIFKIYFLSIYKKISNRFLKFFQNLFSQLELLILYSVLLSSCMKIAILIWDKSISKSSSKK